MSYAELPSRLARVRETIAQHQQAGGWTHPVRIIGVVKTHPPEAVRAAVAAGLEAVGENRVQEALAKMAVVGEAPIAWHLVGTLQRNKVRQIVGRFAMLHAVDRPELVAELGRRIPPAAPQAVLLEVNCAGESAKAGVTPEELPSLLDAAAACPSLRVEGLMTMAPFTDDVAVQRAVFQRLRELRDQAERRGFRLPHLSMGMSGDYAAAVEQGATMVRLGTVLFGERVA